MEEGDVLLSDTLGSCRENLRIVLEEYGGVLSQIVQLKSLLTNEHSMGNKQEEMKTIIQLGNYDLTAISETWWDESHSWNTMIEGYKLFRRYRQGRRGEGLALYFKLSRLWRETVILRLRACGLKLGKRPVKDVSWQESITGCLIMEILLTRHSCFSYRMHHACRLPP